MTAVTPLREGTLLVLAAHPVELEPLRALLSDPTGRPAKPAIATQSAIRTEEVGVGLAAAGAGTARALERHRPTQVLLIGSAGVYPGHAWAIGTAVAATAVHLVDGCVAQGQAAFPDPMLATPPVDSELLHRLKYLTGTDGAGVANTLSITTDDRLAAALADAGPWELENLEAFAVALACQQAHVPFSALLGITNEVGSKGRQQWLTHHRKSAAHVASLVARFAD
ncbi:MAG: hypothetical protein OXU20_18010 [Myxococcales bacterium]|nr:hypothetical protein [Myxococcales bacterium]MDD9971440.1 hypothetical protein [Myxococcales bacterium]